jgi:diguanylate cyclase
MISIKRSMDELSASQERFLAALEAYSKALAAFECAAEVLGGEEIGPFQNNVGAIRRKLVPDVAADTIQQSSAEVEQELDRFAKQFASLKEHKEREFKKIIQIVAEAGATLAESGTAQSAELVQFSRRIESASRLDSIAEMRKQLSSRVMELKAMAARVKEEGQARARELEDRLRSVEEELQTATAASETDALTGLGNRRKGEAAIRSSIASGMPFSLLLLDLNGFKSVNDRFGHTQGDLLLKVFGHDLKASVRKDDLVCRWGGDEFIVLMPRASLADAQGRATRVESGSFGRFVLEHNGRGVHVDISAAIGVSQYVPGETAEEFFDRADRILYERKAQMKLQSGAVQAASAKAAAV